MSTETVKKCDVFGTIKDVKAIRITIAELVVLDEDQDAKVDVKHQRQVDMCERAVERLFRFLDRGTTPPNKKGATDGDDSTDKG